MRNTLLLSPGRTAAAFLMSAALALASPAPLSAGGAKASVKMSKSAAEVKGAALLSVYGRYKARGESILLQPGQYPALEKLMDGKILVLKNSLATSEHLPFKFVDEDTVLKSEAYATLIQDSMSRSEVSTAYVLKSLTGKQSKAERGTAAIEASRAGYFAAPGYGVYLLPPNTLEAKSFGAPVKQREELFRAMGADAAFTAEIEMAAVGLGGLVFGKEAGQVQVTIGGALLLPSGATPYTFQSTAASSKKTLYRMPNAGLTQKHKELVVDTAVELSEEAWESAWGALLEKMSAAMAKK